MAKTDVNYAFTPEIWLGGMQHSGKYGSKGAAVLTHII
jgi:hypothetical protein